MPKTLTRRDFLKLASSLSLGASFSEFNLPAIKPLKETDQNNFLIIVFDTFSAEHLSFSGYPRGTTPHLTKLLKRAKVFHNHQASGAWTIPGTASLLTGTSPLTNRAFNLEAKILERFSTGKQNIFGQMDDYYRFGYTHNPLAQHLLKNFFNSIDDYKPRHELYLSTDIFSLLFDNDYDTASLSGVQILKKEDRGFANSLVLSEIRNLIKQNQLRAYLEKYPRGLPSIEKDKTFLLEDSIDWLQQKLLDVPQPFLGYFHVLPPHDPYTTRQEFINAFENDGYQPKEKPAHLFKNGIPYKELLEKRRWYDEFILYADAEFKRLYDFMEDNNLLDNTTLIITSDHGEMFERRIWGHFEPVLFQPVIHIPLVIFPPGQQAREDYHAPTSALDILPTLLHLSNQAIPRWAEGEVLPGFTSAPHNAPRSIYAVESRPTNLAMPMKIGTVSLLKNNHKLIKYFGYDQIPKKVPMYELFDLENDPEELNNIYSGESGQARLLIEELEEKIRTSNSPYM